MAKSTSKKTARKSKYLKARVDIFEIEKNPPPIIGRWNPERAALLNKLDETLKAVPVGGAFIIPTEQRHPVHKHLRDGYPADKFSFQHIHGNPDKLRVYRLAYTKK
jgi:hypothetical protein